MIAGSKINRPGKEDLADDIAQLCALPGPKSSAGSSIDSAFLDAIHESITGTPTAAPDTYRKTEAVLDALDRTYDPYWDTSESTPSGGGTVTARAFSRIRTALRGEPRCFILNVTDAPVGIRWESNHDEVYRYDSTVTGRRSLNDAGPESRVIYYATSNSKTNRMHFVATATVAYIYPGWEGPWEARLEDYREFPTPVPVSQVQLGGWNRQHAITEISYQTYIEIVSVGGLPVAAGNTPVGLHGRGLDDTDGGDPGGSDVVKRLLHDHPVEDEDPIIQIPASWPSEGLKGDPPVTPKYVETTDGVQSEHVDGQGPTSRNPKRDRLAEQRAVELATKAMASAGWTLKADRQKDGVGYDIEFAKEDRLLKIEVKGIQGSQLAFNVTPKEYWRAETDPDWALVAVTSVLSPSDYSLHFLTRDSVVAATRTITGYRLRL